MTLCEVCGESALRRQRADDFLCCRVCAFRLTSWSNLDLLKESRRLERENSELRAKTAQIFREEKRYAYNNAVSAVPTVDILERAMLALNQGENFSVFSVVLGDYYGIKAPPYYSFPEGVPKDANAVYHSLKNEVYCAKGPLSHRTAFHEFWHALERHGIVPNTEDSEKNANTYAIACLKRLKEAPA